MNKTQDEIEFEKELATVELERMNSISEAGQEPLTEKELAELQSDYPFDIHAIRAVNFQRERGLVSDEAQWENMNFLEDLTMEERSYYKSLQSLHEKSQRELDDSWVWSGEKTSDQLVIEKEKQFKSFINQLELLQTSPLSRRDSDILKATYSPEKEYNVVFGIHFSNKTSDLPEELLSANNMIFGAVYKGGDIVSLQPEHEALFKHLQTQKGHPENILTQLDKSQLLSISNEVTRELDEYKFLNRELFFTRKGEVRQFDHELTLSIQVKDPVERLNRLQELCEKTNKAFQKMERLSEISQKVQPIVEKIIATEEYRSNLDYQMEQLAEELKTPKAYRMGHVRQLELLKDVVEKITSIDFQEIRKHGLENDLYSNPEQGVIVSSFHVEKPFSFQQSADRGEYRGASNFFKQLQSEQVSDPKEIVGHYLKIQESIYQFTDTFRRSDVDLIELSEYARTSFREAVNVVERELKKSNGAFSTLNLHLKETVSHEQPEQYEGMWVIEEIKEKSQLLSAVNKLERDQPITIQALANLKGLDKEQSAYWTQKGVEMTQTQTINTRNQEQNKELKEEKHPTSNQRSQQFEMER